MSRLFPSAEYAEDQPLAHTILATHVLHRGWQSGAVIGLTSGTASYLYRLSRSEVQLRAALKTGRFTSALRTAVYPTFSQTVFRHGGVGALVGVAAMTVGLPLTMRGKEEIEWKDRAYRLMQNEGQLAVDDWSLGGAVIGALSSALRSNVGLRQVVGRTAVGSVVGTFSYLGHRYLVLGVQKPRTVEETANASVAVAI